MANPDTIISEAETEKERVRNNLRVAAQWFHENRGELFKRSEVIIYLSNELNVTERIASRLVSELVGDSVDPVVIVNTKEESYVGVIEYSEGDIWYGYRDYDDIMGERNIVVCAQCVQEFSNDADVYAARSGEGSFSDGTHHSFYALSEAVRDHFGEFHDESPDEVVTGARLNSGTLIASSIVWHAGNDGPGSGLNADTLDGTEASGFVGSNGDTMSGDLDMGDNQLLNVTNFTADVISGAPAPVDVDEGLNMTGVTREILDGGLSAIQFNGSADVTIPGGDLDVTSGDVNITSGGLSLTGTRTISTGEGAGFLKSNHGWIIDMDTDNDDADTRSVRFTKHDAGTDLLTLNEDGSTQFHQGKLTLYDSTEITDGSGVTLGPGSTNGTVIKGSPAGHVSVDIRANNDGDSFQVRYDSSLTSSDADTRAFRVSAEGITYIEGGELNTGANNITMNGGTINMQSGGDLTSVNNINVSTIDSNNGIEPVEITQPFEFQDGVELYLGNDKDISQTYISADSEMKFVADGTTTIFKMAKTGDITIGAGDVIDGAANIVYDQSNNHIPQERVEQGSGSGLDADTVDGQEASALGGSLSTNEIASDASGTVNTGQTGIIHITEVPNGETLSINQASFLLADGQAAPTNLDLIIGTLDGTGTGTSETNVLTGDGSTIHDDETGSPLASYTNSSGSPETVFIGVDNGDFNTGTGSPQEIFASTIGSVA